MIDTSIPVAIINGGLLVVATFVANQNRGIRRHAEDNGNKLDVLEKRTNGELEGKIRAAIKDYFMEHQREVTQAVMAEAMKDLLDALINGDRESIAHD